MNNPFEYQPSEECDRAYRHLLRYIGKLKENPCEQALRVSRLLDEGKMLGVLISSDSNGDSQVLYAFSGQLGEFGFLYPGFVGPVFDYLNPDGYFKTREKEISELNLRISEFENQILIPVKREYEQLKDACNKQIEQAKEKCRIAKSERDRKRIEGNPDAEELAAMIRCSQFEKAELHRLKKRVAEQTRPVRSRLEEAQKRLEELKRERSAQSEALQQWLFGHTEFLNARGETRSLDEIFKDTPLRIPPSGAGECCAPKLLQEAYHRGWHPESMAEYWYGRPKDGELRIEGACYPACRGKCLPILTWMLEGLEVNPPLENDSDALKRFSPRIIFENEFFCVVDKPAGMISVPGKGKSESLQEWLENRYGEERQVKVAHRLDRDTSGLIIATFGEGAYKEMQALFAMRKIKKTYVADLVGDFREAARPAEGRIELPLIPDWLDRPRQRVDYNLGKESVTEYEFTGIENGMSRVVFHPLTGRTHQLRVHAASHQGLGMPIAGDPLYGKEKSDRLHLHSSRIEFVYPPEGKRYIFESPVPF